MNHKTIYCTVSNDINHDQRMHRICSAISACGYEVHLIGRRKKDSKPLGIRTYSQKRLNCWFEKGPLFYLELNLRLIVFLLTQKTDIVYAVDTDTLLAGTVVKIIKGKKLIFDSHEYFTEVPEVQSRRWVKMFWTSVETLCIPWSDAAITVNESLAKILGQKYNKVFKSVYNVPVKGSPTPFSPSAEMPYIIYQGALNQGRGLESLIIAMDYIDDLILVIAGEGDLSVQLRYLAEKGRSNHRIIFKGWQSSLQLQDLTQQATLGTNLLEKTSLNYYFSLANKFFDYMHAGIPSLNMDFPEYKEILSKYDVGYVIDNLDPINLASEINKIIKDKDSYNKKKASCYAAREMYNWENESVKLIEIVKSL